MDPQWRYCQSRLNVLENDIHYQSKVYNQVKNRNDSHSAKLKYLEDELDTLRYQNVSLKHELNDLRCKTLDDRHHSHGSPMPPKEQHIQVDVSPRYNKKDIEKKNVEFQREMHTHREAYRNQMFGTDRENRFNLKVRKPNDESKDRNDDVQIKHATDRVELHPGNFKPWVYQRPLYESTAHHDGVYLFIRANKSGRDKIIHALKRNRTVLGISGGKLKGIAEPSQVHVIEGSTEGWFSNGEKDIFVCVLWFDSDKRAIKWIEYDKQFKHPSFPDPRGCDMMIAPINWEPNDLHYRTFLVMEYKGINEDQKAKIRDILARHQKGSGGSFVVQTAGVRNYRGDWMKPNTLMTCHVFQSTDDAERFVKDSEFTGLRNELKRTYGAGINSVAFTVDQLY